MRRKAIWGSSPTVEASSEVAKSAASRLARRESCSLLLRKSSASRSVSWSFIVRACSTAARFDTSLRTAINEKGGRGRGWACVQRWVGLG